MRSREERSAVQENVRMSARHVTSKLEKRAKRGFWYKMAYEVVTPESAKKGDVADRGWEKERSDTYASLKDLLRDVGRKANWIEWSSTNPNGSLISEGKQDNSDGSEKSYNLWIKHEDGQPLSAQEMRFISKELGVSFGKMHG
jgi:hypothetical protein